MEFFNEAKAVRLKSHLEKYLVADEDEETVRQSSNGSSRKARWYVELVERNPHVLRLKSCYGGYLTASEEPYLLGMTGKKVVQTLIPDIDAKMEWEPIKEGYKVKLRTKGGKFLRANGATPPWRNSITHDLPYRTATQDWVLWEVDVVDISGLADVEYLPSFNSNCSSVSAIGSERSFQHSFMASQKLWWSSIASQKRLPSNVSDKSSLEGMEFFHKAKSIRLQSYHGKYLVADEDEETVRQSRNGSSHKARWAVEFVDGQNDKIRLKSCHGLYLTSVDSHFLLGMTGKKVLQTMPHNKTDVSIQWIPVKEGSNNIKLMTNEGKFLRANGGAPPWRNSITHDVPYRTATQNWVLWSVDIVDISISDSDTGSDYLMSSASSFCSLADDYSGGSPETGSPMAISIQRQKEKACGMEFFKKAKSVRLKSHHDKYLTADPDEETVIQDRSGSSKCAKWNVEFVEGVENVIRMKSCFGKYLTSSEEQFLLGVTGQKVVQTLPRKLDSSIEWEPIRDGMQVKLKTRYGNYLRANGGLPPWRNSITHDIPHRHHDWILWEVEVIEIRPESPPKDSLDHYSLSSSNFLLRQSTANHDESVEESTRKSEGRMICYHVSDDDGNVNDGIEGPSFLFKGHGLQELTQKLEEETGIEDIIICSRNRLNGKLYPLRLALPPNNATMRVVVVPSSSRAARDFLPADSTSA